MTEENGAERPCDITDGEAAEGGDRADSRIKGREEQVTENERGSRRVEKEIIPLDRRSDEG
jgi:hypothetical protein